MLTPTYMDYSSTTPVDPRVAKKMAKYLTMEGDFGNAASRSHYYGWQAEKAVDEARSQVADLVGADPREIDHLSELATGRRLVGQRSSIC